ncbi:MAG: SPOR domain-containing protein [Pseudomonadota bacterium]
MTGPSSESQPIGSAESAGLSGTSTLPGRTIGARVEGWQIQLGAVGSAQEAEQLLAAAAKKLPSVNGLNPVTEPVETNGGTLYRARFAGFEDQRAALAACKHFANHDRPCWATSM